MIALLYLLFAVLQAAGRYKHFSAVGWVQFALMLIAAVMLDYNILSMISLKRVKSSTAKSPDGGAGNSDEFRSLPERLVEPGLDFGTATDIGTREYQQDAARVMRIEGTQRGIAVVCDGIGSMPDSDKGSQGCCDVFVDLYSKKNPSDNCVTFIKETVVAADSMVKGLHTGTTLTVTIIEDGKVYWGSVGDSHIYHIHEGVIKRLNREHNHLNTNLLPAVARGEMTMEQAQSDRRKAALTSFVGGLKELDVCIQPVVFAPGDSLVLCSDGIYGLLSDDEIKGIVTANPSDAPLAAQQLILAAKFVERRGKDNMTAAVVHNRV